jgi:hypothetical protein
MTTDSQRQERQGAKEHGGVVNSGSGNGTGHKNDVRTVSRSIEFKYTKAKSYSLKLASLKQAEKEALLDSRDMLFQIRFDDSGHCSDYVILTKWDYFNLKDPVGCGCQLNPYRCCCQNCPWDGDHE